MGACQVFCVNIFFVGGGMYPVEASGQASLPDRTAFVIDKKNPLSVEQLLSMVVCLFIIFRRILNQFQHHISTSIIHLQSSNVYQQFVLNCKSKK